MSFHLYSHGQDLGETDFELTHERTKRAGAFRPTQLGVSLLPTLTGIGPALIALGKALPETELTDADMDAAMAAFAGSQVADFAQKLDDLKLELRDANDRVVPTKSMAVHDVEQTFGPEAVNQTPDRLRYIISATLAVGAHKRRASRKRQ